MKKLLFVLIIFSVNFASAQFVIWDGDPSTALYDPNTSINWMHAGSTKIFSTADNIEIEFEDGGLFPGYRWATLEEIHSYANYMGYVDSNPEQTSETAVNNLGASLGFSAYMPYSDEPWLGYGFEGTIGLSYLGYNNFVAFTYGIYTDEYEEPTSYSLNFNTFTGSPTTTHFGGYSWLLVQDVSPVPEPSEIGMIALPLGLGLILFLRRKSRK